MTSKHHLSLFHGLHRKSVHGRVKKAVDLSPSLLSSLGEQEHKGMDIGPPLSFLGHSGDTIFFSNGANGNARKRKRPVEETRLQSRSLPLVSVQSNNQPLSLYSSGFPGELNVKFGQPYEEIRQLLADQGEQLRRALTELRQRHNQALHDTVVERLQEKQTEVHMASKRATELENGLARLRAESKAWRDRVVADQATIAALHAQLQQAVGKPAQDEECGESPDSESVCVDQNSAGRRRVCRGCRVRPAAMVMLPCRHLSLCSECESTSAARVAMTCPVCRSQRTGSLHVFSRDSCPNLKTNQTKK